MSDPVVFDASAGVELLLNTDAGRALRDRLPQPGEEWVPEIYLAEVAGALRRAELAGRVTPARAEVALSDLLAAPQRRAQIKPLLSEAWMLRHNITVRCPLRRASTPPGRATRDG